jgi:peptidoglycan biosynthesis protein MviN/MurJ (putative lipid II flippase)
VILVAIGRTRLVVVLTFAEILLGVGLMLALAPRYGLIGIALASFIANVLIGFFLQVPIAARAAQVTLGELLGNAIGRIALAAIPAILTAAALHSAFEDMGLLMLIGAVACVVLVYAASLWGFGVRRDEREMYLTMWRNASGG